MDQAYIGTELKYLVEITASGFSMINDDFNILLKRGSTTHLFQKDDLVRDGDDFYLCFDSAEFGKGPVTVVITAYVPDTDFDDGLRTEVYKFDLVTTLGV